MPFAARLIAISTAVAGATAVAVAALAAGDLPVRLAVSLAIAAILTELMQVSGGDGVGKSDVTDFTFSSGVLLAAVIALGSLGAALILPLAVAFVDELRGRPRFAIAFNAGVAAVAALVAGSAYQLAGGRVGEVALPRQLPQLLLAAGVAYGVNLLLVEGLVSAISRRRFRGLVVATARGQILSATSEAGFGIAFAYFLIAAPWGALTLAPLVVGVFKAHARVELHRRETARALETFANVVDERDSFTAHHSLRVAQTVQAFAEWLGCSPEDAARLRWAGRLHDLGKVTVDRAILHKPGSLDEQEWEAMRAHPRLSARLLRRFSLAGDEARAVELHHERFDGRGYYGVPREQIPLAAHLLVVADTFDAITSDRPYRSGFSRDEALAEVERCSGAQFHPAVAKAFVAFHRGIQAEHALSERDRAELGELWRAQCDVSRRAFRRPSSATIAVGLAVAALAAGGLGALQVAGSLTVAATAVLLVVAATHERARRLAGRLAGALEEGDLHAAVASIASAAPLRFAALSTADSAAPVRLMGVDMTDNLALRAWLASNADPDLPAVAQARSVGASGFVVAVPVGEPEAGTHLVLHFDAEPPPILRRALERCLASFRSCSPASKVTRREPLPTIA